MAESQNLLQFAWSRLSRGKTTSADDIQSEQTLSSRDGDIEGQDTARIPTAALPRSRYSEIPHIKDLVMSYMVMGLVLVLAAFIWFIVWYVRLINDRQARLVLEGTGDNVIDSFFKYLGEFVVIVINGLGRVLALVGFKPFTVDISWFEQFGWIFVMIFVLVAIYLLVRPVYVWTHTRSRLDENDFTFSKKGTAFFMPRDYTVSVGRAMLIGVDLKKYFLDKVLFFGCGTVTVKFKDAEGQDGALVIRNARKAQKLANAIRAAVREETSNN
jgi:hypothetical protein